MSRLKTSPTMFFLLTIVIFIHFNSACAASDSNRLSKLDALKSSSSSKLMRFNTKQFEEYIESSPRSYNVFVLLTADPSMCKPCGPMRGQLEQVAKDYENLSAKKKSSKPNFFAELKISTSDQTLLQKYGIRHVPIFYAFRASSSRAYPTVLNDESPDNYPLQEVGLSANQIKDFINQRSGSKFNIVRGGYQIPFVRTVRQFMPAILMLVALATITAILTGVYKSPMVWFGLVVLLYIFSVGGGHYSWIHDTPMAVVNKDGGWEYIASGSRSQYVAEGFFVSVTCVSISVLVILIQEMPHLISNKATQTVLGLGMLGLTFVAITALLVMYHFVSLHPVFIPYFACQGLSSAFMNTSLLTSPVFLFICLSFHAVLIDRKCHNTCNIAKCKAW